MKIIVACDSFKGCMNSWAAGNCIKKGINRANNKHQVQVFGMADGGEGTASVFNSIIGGSMIDCKTVDAYGKPVISQYCMKDDIAIMDVASCIGLNMTPREKRNPMIANSCGVGIMMKDIIAHGCKKIVIGLGGSATLDGGMGILSVFGADFYDAKRDLLTPNIYALGKIAFIDKRHFSLPEDVELICACDVTNHLLGDNMK